MTLLRAIGLAGVLILFPATHAHGQSPTAGQPPEDVQEEGRVEEEITVSETSVLIDLRDVATSRQTRRLELSDFRIAEDDVPRDPIRLTQVLGTPEDKWHILIYFDVALAQTETVRQAAASLGQIVPELVRLGEVRIVMTDERPGEVVAPTRNVIELEDALAEIAKRAAGQDRINGLRQRYTATLARAESDDLATRVEALSREVELVRRQGDHILRLVGAGCPADACALFLVSDGFEIVPEIYYLGRAWATAHPETGIQAERTAIELSESLSAAEWLTLALPLRPPQQDQPEDRPRGPGPGSDYELFTQLAGSHFDGINIRRRRSTFDELPLASFDVYLLPTLQPLRMLADETSGAILRSPEQLADEVSRLGDRHRLWYRTTRPIDGRIRPVEVRLARDNKLVRAPLWVDSSTPEGVAAARVRGLLDDIGSEGELPLGVTTAVRAATNRTLRLVVDWGKDSPVHAAAKTVPLRVSVAHRSGRGPVEINHQLLVIEARPGTTRTEQEVRVAIPDDATEVAVLLEELRYRLWGARKIQG